MAEEKEKPSSLKALLAHGVRHWKTYLLGVVSLAAVDFINSLLLPCLIGIPFEGQGAEEGHALFAPFFRELLGVKEKSAARVFLECGLLYVAINVAQMVLRYFWRYFFMGGAERIGFEVRESFFRKLQRLPVAWFDRAKTGDLMSRATNDIDAVKSAYAFGALMAFDSLCYFVMVPLALLKISPKLTGMLCLTLPFVSILIYKLGGTVHRRSRIVQDIFGKLSARLQESFSGIRVVQAFAQEEREAERFEEVAREYLSGQLSLARVQTAWGPSFEAIFEIAGALILILGGLDVVKGDLAASDFVRFIRGIDNLIWPMAAIGMLANTLQRGAAAHARLDEILAEAEDPAFRTEKVPADAAVQGAISVRALTYSFPGATGKAPALEDVSFEVPAGALVAVVGPVGSGKSSLLSLMARLYEPPRGTIFLDGRDILEIPIATLRRSVALVPQETFLFSTTIEENVRLGRASELTREHVEAAARAAQVADEVRGVPGGFDALLGERGVNLSGGQRQRVAIARALVRTPRVLLLDDALSAVDTETETKIDQQIRASSGTGSPPTRFVATHRLAAARNADLILVLERGRLVEQGSHRELISRGGLYARLARRDALTEELAHVS